MKRFNILRGAMLLTVVSGLTFLMSCNDGEKMDSAKDPIASFSAVVDATDFLKVTFTNLSQNADSYSWDFGDGTGTSIEASPVYTYATDGTYVVTLSATNEDESTDDFTLTVVIEDPASAIRALVGEGNDGKVWQLIADVSTNRFPYTVQPTDNSVFWWALGANEELCVRECIFDDTWTFKADGSYDFNNNGDFFANDDWPAELDGTCFDTSVAANWVGAEGDDLSGWGSGTYAFEYDPTEGTLDVTGGFIGLPDATPDGEVDVPAAAISYDVLELIEGDVDTLVVEVVYANGDSPTGFAYWRSTLVSYDQTTPVAIDECEVVEVVAPTTAAPTPTQSSDVVISMFSDSYTDVTVDTWRTDWSSATLEDVTIDGSAMKKYTALDFVGIEATGDNSIDASASTHFHVDIWTANATQFNVKLVDFGADNAFAGGDDSEHQVDFASPAQGSWVSLDIPMADFTGLASSEHISQLILVGVPTGSANVFVDNVYFYTEE